MYMLVYVYAYLCCYTERPCLGGTSSYRVVTAYRRHIDPGIADPGFRYKGLLIFGVTCSLWPMRGAPYFYYCPRILFSLENPHVAKTLVSKTLVY